MARSRCRGARQRPDDDPRAGRQPRHRPRAGHRSGPGRREADERKVKQIVFNLLSNAVKFTPDGGEVDVCALRIVERRRPGGRPRQRHRHRAGGAGPGLRGVPPGRPAQPSATRGPASGWRCSGASWSSTVGEISLESEVGVGQHVRVHAAERPTIAAGRGAIRAGASGVALPSSDRAPAGGRRVAGRPSWSSRTIRPRSTCSPFT